MNTFKQLPKSVKVTFIIICSILVISIVFNVILLLNSKDTRDAGAATEAEIKSLVAEVSRFIVLPDKEIPTLATVSEPEKLRNQSFFANTEVGDKVLIYTASRKAILWRPSVKKIVEVSALNVDAGVASSTPTKSI